MRFEAPKLVCDYSLRLQFGWLATYRRRTNASYPQIVAKFEEGGTTKEQSTGQRRRQESFEAIKNSSLKEQYPRQNIDI